MYTFVSIVYSSLHFPRATNGPDRAIHKTKTIIQGGTFCKNCICIDLKASRIKKVVIVLGYSMAMEVVNEVNYCVTDHAHHRNSVTKTGN